jgi:NADH dehydrogenase FAD-containing subunit
VGLPPIAAAAGGRNRQPGRFWRSHSHPHRWPGVAVDGARIEASTVLRAAEVAASPAAWLNAPADKAGRLIVGDDLRVPGLANVFAIGDTAASRAWKGEIVPGLAPAAKQGGTYVAKQIRAMVESRRQCRHFVIVT